MNLVILLAAVAALGAYVCRLDALSWRRHRPSVMVAHLIGAVASSWALVEAINGVAGWLAALALAPAIGLLWVSFHSWRAGPPWWAHKVSVPCAARHQSPAAGSAKTSPARSAGRPA